MDSTTCLLNCVGDMSRTASCGPLVADWITALCRSSCGQESAEATIASEGRQHLNVDAKDVGAMVGSMKKHVAILTQMLVTISKTR
jgi:hypothetical protein